MLLQKHFVILHLLVEFAFQQRLRILLNLKELRIMSESEIEGFINKVESGLVEAQHDMLVEKVLSFF